MPVKLILYTPMLSDSFVKVGRGSESVTQIEAVLFLLFAACFSHGMHHDDRLDILPGQRLFQQVSAFTHITGVGFYASAWRPPEPKSTCLSQGSSG